MRMPCLDIKQQFFSAEMGTYSNRNHVMPEANAEAPVPHFAWFYHGSIFPAPRSTPRPPPGTQFNAQSSLPVAPIRSIPGTTEPAKTNNLATKPKKGKKKKTSVKGSDRVPSDILSPKTPKKKSSKNKKQKSMPGAKREKNNLNIDMDGINVDLSGVPSPFCSCTGMPRNCYKWGASGWQSSCCTTNISEYPLPMSSTRPGTRLAGRKMSNGAYMKLLLKLAGEGYDLSHPVDLKDHWARHGTNKFVTIK